VKRLSADPGEHSWEVQEIKDKGGPGGGLLLVSWWRGGSFPFEEEKARQGVGIGGGVQVGDLQTGCPSSRKRAQEKRGSRDHEGMEG